MVPRQLIIDTDPGLDDTAALLFALGCTDRVSVAFLTSVFGNVGVELTTRNALAILDIAGRPDIPVYRGADRPLLRPPNLAPHIHGDDGLGGFAGDYGASRSAADGIAAMRIVEHVMAHPNEVTIVALGPLTNIALALRLEPRVADAVQQIVVMGGAVKVPGNVTPVASANLVNDPEAAAIVYESCNKITQAGLDVASAFVLVPAYLDRIAAEEDARCRMVARAAESITAAYSRLYGAQLGARFNDVPTICYAIEPDLFVRERYRVEVERGGDLTSGMTVVDWRHQYGRDRNTDVLLEVQSTPMLELFTERVINPV